MAVGDVMSIPPEVLVALGFRPTDRFVVVEECPCPEAGQVDYSCPPPRFLCEPCLTYGVEVPEWPYPS